MGFRFSAKIRGSSLQSVRKNLDSLISKVERQGKREALTKAARAMVKAVKSNVAVDRGHLKKSIKFKIRTYKKDSTIIAVIGPDRQYRTTEKGKKIRPVLYAVAEEFGTVHREGKPFMRPAFDLHKKRVFTIYYKELQASIKRVGRRFNRKLGNV